jgi:hypothetical protein
VESSCKLGNESSGSIKCWELPDGCTTSGLSSGTQLQELVSSTLCPGFLYFTLATCTYHSPYIPDNVRSAYIFHETVHSEPS